MFTTPSPGPGTQDLVMAVGPTVPACLVPANCGKLAGGQSAFSSQQSAVNIQQSAVSS